MNPFPPQETTAAARRLARLVFSPPTLGLDGLGTGNGHDEPLDLDDPAQRQFGEFELLELIGQGGMGLVYRARAQRLQREVAVKLLSAGPWASREFVARFQDEARHAATLQHPGIVSVYEMGEVDGLVYYAMELVRGESLAQRLDADGAWPARAAAALVRTVAEALDYAHSLGVLHLDLKPGNVLIDPDGRPKVADFGLARRYDQAGLDTEHISGTPNYMAPEQADMRHGEISPATDVWGLGGLLYELLCAHPPFEANDPPATLHLLRRGQVRVPSRYTPVPPDLEAICMRCLAHAPQERYPSARALADDLGRYLNAEPVQARPLGLAGRTWRLCRREPRLSAVAALAMLALLVGTAVSTRQWLRAEANATTAREVNRFLNDDVLAAADPYRGGHDQLTVPELLAQAEQRLDRGLLAQPASRAEVGLSLGRAYFGLGLWSHARARLAKTHAEARAALGANHPLVLDIEEHLALTSTYDSHYAQATALYAHLIPSRTRQRGPHHPATLEARRGQALLLQETDQFERAVAAYEALGADARVHAPAQLAAIEWALSELYTELNRWDEAEALMRDALRRSLRELGPDHPQYLWETMSLGDLYMMQARWDEADRVFTDARDKLIRAVGPEHPKTLTAIHYLGVIRLERGSPSQALPLLQAAMAGRMRVHTENHKYTQYSMNRVGQALIALGQPRDAVTLLEHTLEVATRVGSRRQAYVLLILDNLGRAHLALDEPAKARAWLQEAERTAQDTLPADNVRRGMIERSLGELEMREGHESLARSHFEYAARVFSEAWGERHPWVRNLRRRIAGDPLAPSADTKPNTAAAQVD